MVFSFKFNDPRQSYRASGEEHSNTDSAQWGEVEANTKKAWVHNSVNERKEN